MLKGGIVGLGNLGKRYITLMDQESRTECIGIYDIDREKVRRISKETGLKGFASLQELLEAEGLNFVYIATPDFAHKEPVLEAASRGLDILVEKPLATSVADAQEMLNAVKKAGVKAQIAFSNRFNQPFVVAKREVEEGRLGDILSINTRLSNTLMVPTRMLSWAAKSSPAWFLMSHTMDVAYWLHQKEAKTVYATGVKKVLVEKGIDTWDSLQVAVKYEDGTQGFFESMWVLPEGKPLIVDFKFVMVGTKGAVEIDTHDQMMHFIGERFEHSKTLDIELNGRLLGQTANTFQAYVDSLSRNEQPSPSLEDGLRNVKMLEAVHTSAAEERIIEL